VTDPANAAVDLSITKTLIGDSPVENGPVQFSVTIINNGPNDAVNAHFVDDTFTNATFSSITQTDGPSFICSGSGVDCTLAQFPKGAEAQFLLNFTAGVAGGNLQNTATISSDTAELNTLDNSFTTAAIKVGSGTPPPSCTLDCPENINALADTEENGQRGTHVTFADAGTSGTCGNVTSSPASGSFFPVGTTTVVVTSDQGNGSCSFTINVADTGTNPPTISCPTNKTGNADNNCELAINAGTASATGNNVTVIASRSDGKAMYTCDVNGTNCTRNSSDVPFPAGVTTITWIAYSHDVAGPYADADTEEAHRTGAASCTQTVTVNDVTPPTINAPNQTVAADANCKAVVPDYSNTASDNCACSSSDTSESCVGRERIVVTQSIAAGTLVGPGTYTITLTANDGSSNNGGAGNTTTTTTTFTVADQTAPAIICPANILNVHTDPGICAATVNPGAATASDNCSTPTIVGVRSDSQPLNALYPKGTTTITWTATDAAGNHSSCVQTITVIDVEPPTISCQADIIADFDPAVNGATVNYTTPVGTDNCPGATTARIAGLASGSVFPVGTTTNTFKVTDASGNTAQCSFKVTVALTSIIGLDSATLSGNALVDSYDSTGGYPATKGSLANLLSNGTLSVLGSSKMFGNVRSTRVGVTVQGTSQVTGNATAGTTVSKGASAIIGGTITNNALAPVMTLPSVPACGPPYSPNSGISGTYTYNSSTGDLSLSGINIATLANGNYCFHNVTLTNSGQLKINGPVTIKLTGTFNAGGASTVNNTTLIPSNLRILSSYSGSNGVIFSNGNSAYLLIYAPQTSVTNSGSAPLFGTIVGKTVTISNSGMLHYDVKLKAIWPELWTLIIGP
jgi:hypothetical protein